MKLGLDGKVAVVTGASKGPVATPVPLPSRQPATQPGPVHHPEEVADPGQRPCRERHGRRLHHRRWSHQDAV